MRDTSILLIDNVLKSSLNYTKQLKADNERLREAIKELQKFDVDVVFKKICNEALAKTPAQCLIEHDTKVLQDALKERDLQENKAFNDKVLNDFYDSVKD